MLQAQTDICHWPYGTCMYSRRWQADLQQVANLSKLKLRWCLYLNGSFTNTYVHDVHIYAYTQKGMLPCYINNSVAVLMVDLPDLSAVC